MIIFPSFFNHLGGILILMHSQGLTIIDRVYSVSFLWCWQCRFIIYDLVGLFTSSSFSLGVLYLSRVCLEALGKRRSKPIVITERIFFF